MKKSIKKGAIEMTNQLAYAGNMIENSGLIEETNEYERKKTKYDLIATMIKIRGFVYSESAKKIINDYIIKKDGRYFIKGTRITTDDIYRSIFSNLNYKENKKVKDIKKEYPSLEDDKQVIAGVIMCARKQVTLINIMKALI